MTLRATPFLLLLTSLSVGTPALNAQKVALETGCTRQQITPPKDAKAVNFSAARVRVVEGARERVARQASEAGVSEPKGVFVLRAGKDRSTVALAAQRSNVPEPLLDAVAAGSADLFAGWPEKSEALVAVRLDSVAVPEAPVGAERTFCVPQPLNATEVASVLEHHIAGRPALVTKRGSRATVRFLLTREGEILAPELKQLSGNYQWDQIALEAVRRMRFTPAQVDGVPLDAWTTLPFHMKGTAK